MKTDAMQLFLPAGARADICFPAWPWPNGSAATMPGLHISFCGSGKAFEREHVSRAGFDYFALPSRPLPRRRSRSRGVRRGQHGRLSGGRTLPAKTSRGGRDRTGRLRQRARWASRPARCGVPLVLLEQNVVPGKATRCLARRASLICTAFASTASLLRCGCPVRVTGNPIRPGFVRGNRVPPPIPKNPATVGNDSGRFL